MKTKIIIVIVGIILFGSTAGSLYWAFSLRSDRNRLQDNIRYGFDTGFKIEKYYKSKNGELVAKNAVLQLTNKELVSSISTEVIKQLENMGIKPNRVTFYTENQVTTHKEFITHVNDTLIDTIPAETFSYHDKFYDVHGLRIGDNQRISIFSTDSIIQAVYWGDRYTRTGKKMPGWWIFSKRRLEQSILCKNPSSKVTYSKTIQIIK